MNNFIYNNFDTILISVSTLLIIPLLKLLRDFQRRLKLSDLEYDRLELDKCHKSGLEYMKMSFIDLYWILILISLANLLPLVDGYFNFFLKPSTFNMVEFFTFIFWYGAALSSFWALRKNRRLKKFDSSISEIDRKILKIKSMKNE